MDTITKIFIGIVTFLVVLGVVIGVGVAAYAFGRTTVPAAVQQPVVNDPPPAGNVPQPTAPANPAVSGPTHGIPVTWSPLAANSAAIVREIVWSADGATAEVWVYWTHGMPEDLVIGAAWDGQAGHVRDAWTSEDGMPWPTMGYEACKESTAVKAGGLGITSVVVHLADGNGGFVDVPQDCSGYADP